MNLFESVIAYENMRSREKSGSADLELQESIARNTAELQARINSEDIANRVKSAMQDFFRNNGRC